MALKINLNDSVRIRVYSQSLADTLRLNGYNVSCTNRFVTLPLWAAIKYVGAHGIDLARQPISATLTVFTGGN